MHDRGQDRAHSDQRVNFRLRLRDADALKDHTGESAHDRAQEQRRRDDSAASATADRETRADDFRDTQERQQREKICRRS